MKTFRGWLELTAALPTLPLSARVDLPLDLAPALAESEPDLAALAAVDRLAVMADDDDEPHPDFVSWMPVAVLREMRWPAPVGNPARDPGWRHFLQSELGRSARYLDLFRTPWDDEDTLELAWPPTHSRDARLDAWARALHGLHGLVPGPDPTGCLQRCSRAELRLLEHRLGLPLPEALRDYHLHLGVSDFGDTLHAVRDDVLAAAIPPIARLADALPRGHDTAVHLSDGRRRQGEALVCFGSFPGLAIHWCFDRVTQAIWLVDLDEADGLTRVCDNAADCLDMLAVRALARTREDLDLTEDGDAEAEALLRERLGHAALERWLY